MFMQDAADKEDAELGEDEVMLGWRGWRVESPDTVSLLEIGREGVLLIRSVTATRQQQDYDGRLRTGSRQIEEQSISSKVSNMKYRQDICDRDGLVRIFVRNFRL
jgi:hypothetical protein